MSNDKTEATFHPDPPPLRLPVTWLNYEGDTTAGVEADIAAGKSYGQRHDREQG